MTAVLMDPADGLRGRDWADQIAAFALAALRVSQAVFRVVRGMRPGMTERDVSALMGYAGEPLSMHPIVASGAPGQPINGLRSPGGRGRHRRRHLLWHRLLGIALLSRRARRGGRGHRLLRELRPALLSSPGSLVRNDRHRRYRR